MIFSGAATAGCRREGQSRAIGKSYQPALTWMASLQREEQMTKRTKQTKPTKPLAQALADLRGDLAAVKRHQPSWGLVNRQTLHSPRREASRPKG
jgi:hypothetical protein